MKAKELRNLTLEELREKFIGLKQELFSMRESLYTTKLEKPQRIKQAHKDIARIATIINEREKKDGKT